MGNGLTFFMQFGLYDFATFAALIFQAFLILHDKIVNSCTTRYLLFLSLYPDLGFKRLNLQGVVERKLSIFFQELKGG